MRMQARLKFTIVNGNAKDDSHEDDNQEAAGGGPPPEAVQMRHAHSKHKVGRPKCDDPVRKGHAVCSVQVMRPLSWHQFEISQETLHCVQ